MKVLLKKVAHVPGFVSGEIFLHLRKAIQSTGVRAYVVGGYVRDRLLETLNRPNPQAKPREVDILIDQDPEILLPWIQKHWKPEPRISWYRRFRTCAIFWKDWTIEIAGARKESYPPDSRKPHVQPATIEEDFLRRDFTINALAISLNPSDFGWLYDPFTGIDDLKHQKIRTPVDPLQTFSDDPLRMLRAIRFATILGFEIEHYTWLGIRGCHRRIQIVSPERISEELNKILMAPRPSRGFRLMMEAGLLRLILPEVVALAGVEEREGKAHKDNFLHTLTVLDNVAQTSQDLYLRWAALLHDIGKPRVKRYDPQEGWTFHGHDVVGARMVRPIFRRLRLPLDARFRKVEKLVRLHQRPIYLVQSAHLTDSAIRRLIHEAGEDLEDLLTLCRADITTANPHRRRRFLHQFDLLRKRIREVEERDRIRNFQPPITGEIIMEVFGIRPSRTVGEIKQAIKDAILDGTIPNDFISAFQFMLELGKRKGLTPRYSSVEEFITANRDRLLSKTPSEPSDPATSSS